jgi:hypothetical protein
MKCENHENKDNLVECFNAWADDGNFSFPEGHVPNLKAFFEHGQWWVTDMTSGAAWSVHDSEGPLSGYDFEQVSDGDL